MKRLFNVVLFGLVGACLASPNDARAAGSNELVLSTGSEQGLYHRLGQAVAEAAMRQGMIIRLVPSRGSAENLEWLSQRKVDLCFAQSDTARDALRGTGSFSNAFEGLRGLASLYTEPVHVLVRNPLHIRRVEEMARKRVSVGPIGSGTELNAMAVLAAAGLGPNDIAIVHLAMGEVVQALNAGSIDIAFITAGCPAEVIDRAVRDGEASLFGLNSDICQRLLESYKGFVITTIGAGTYPQQGKSLDTVGVSALLMARSDMDKGDVQRVLNVLADLPPFQGSRLACPPTLKLVPVSRVCDIPDHSGATRFFAESEIMRWPRLLARLGRYAIVIGGMSVIVAIWLFRSRLRRYFCRCAPARAALVFLSILVGGSLAMYFSERQINDNYSSVLAAFWSTLCNWLNFGQKEPYSMAGRATATAMTIFGVGAISWLTAQVASIYTERRMKEGDMCDGFDGHIVILNWNAKGQDIVKGLLEAEVEKSNIVIVTDNPEAASAKTDMRVCLKTCDTTSEEWLGSVGIARASSIIILSDGRLQGGNADANNVLLVLTVKKLLRDACASHVHIVVEMTDPRRSRLSEHLAMPKEAPVEVVSAQHLLGAMIVQVAVNPGVTRIYEDLLTFGEGTNEVYRWVVRGSLVGKSVDEAFEECAKLRKEGTYILPLAFERKGTLHVNPTSGALGKIEAGDILYAICDQAKVISHLDG